MLAAALPPANSPTPSSLPWRCKPTRRSRNPQPFSLTRTLWTPVALDRLKLSVRISPRGLDEIYSMGDRASRPVVLIFFLQEQGRSACRSPAHPLLHAARSRDGCHYLRNREVHRRDSAAAKDRYVSRSLLRVGPEL